MSTYKEFGFDDFGIRTMPAGGATTFQSQRTQFNEVTARTLKVGSGADPGDIVKVFKADGTQVFVIDTTYGWVEIGDEIPPTNNDPQIALYITKDTDDYFGVNMQNINSGEYASTDFIFLNDQTTTENYDDPLAGGDGYLDIGVNSSGWNNSEYGVQSASGGFVDVGCDLFLGTSGEYGIYFYTQGHDSKSRIKVSINSQGVLFPFQATTVAAPDYVEGGMYYNTTEHKMYIGGAAAWEEVSSA